MTTPTCALSPSYFHSHVKSTWSNLWRTSCMPLVGWASIGFNGMPAVRLQWTGSCSTPYFNNADINVS